jgi:hypothetical protein
MLHNDATPLPPGDTSTVLGRGLREELLLSSAVDLDSEGRRLSEAWFVKSFELLDDVVYKVGHSKQHGGIPYRRDAR